MATGVFSFADCRLEVPTHQLVRSGQPVALRRVVFDLIVHLLRIRPRVATRKELAEQVWKRPDVSAGMIAKAVMEARRAIGDSGTEPEMIVSLHGLGYRFAAAVKEGAEPEPVSDDDGLTASVRAAAERADRALDSGDHALAQVEAERALTLAEAGGVSRTRIEAMLVCARVANVTGPAERMTRLAQVALRLAKAEQHPDLVAAAQVELARAHMMQGSALMTLDLLKPALQHLQAAGPSPLLLRCEMLMRRAHGDLQQFTDAQAWCRRAQATAEQLGNPLALRKERNNEVSLLLTEGMWWAEQGQDGRARETYDRALAVSEMVAETGRSAPASADTPETRLLWLGNHSFALMMTDRLDEAWHYAKAFGEALDQWPSPDSPYMGGWRALFHGHMGLLLGRSRRFTEAFARVEAGVALATARNALPILALLYRYAVDVSLCAGLHEKAFGWLRRQHIAERQLMSEQAAKLTALLRAETDTLELSQELADAQRRVQELERRNRELAQQVRQLDGASGIDAQGFSTPSVLDGAMAIEHARARELDTPYCLLMLRVDNWEVLAAEHLPSELDAFFAALARQLMAIEALRQPAVRWRPSVVLAATDKMGARRMGLLADELLALLHGADWGGAVALHVPPVFSCRHGDGAAYADLREAVAALEAE